jgi:hypothetical protein
MAAKEPVNNEISCMRSPEHKNIMARYGVHETENLEYLIVDIWAAGLSKTTYNHNYTSLVKKSSE